MGGTAYIIAGRLSAERLGPIPLPKNLLDSLLGRQRYAKPVTHSLGTGTMTEVPCKELEVIPKQFIEYVSIQLQKPTDVDELMLSYLKMRVTRTYVRLERGLGTAADQDYVQISFSGCAGLAEVCATVAWHWFDRWYRENALRLKNEILLPFGFDPTDGGDPGHTNLFLPVANVGYVAFYPVQEKPGAGEFELDGSMEEEGRAEAILDALNRDYAAVFADGRCRCTFCSPDFPPVQLRT